MFRRIQKKPHIIENMPLPADCTANITNCRFSKASFSNGYRGQCLIQQDYMTSCMITLKSDTEIAYNTSAECQVNFLSPEVYPDTLWTGRIIEMYEGQRHVGSMEVLSILNPVLDRDAHYNDIPDVLMDFDILNRALALSLEWGKAFLLPLDIKIMKTDNHLSGKDIDKISDFVLQVQKDILWCIYYENFDARTQKFIIDPAAETIKKYPWICHDNLQHLHAQGWYYARHG